ncbi:hypothetical protein ACUXAV_003056 [Cupriavidus metallidurans]|jgi:hypothetical protein|uniref:Uncharacterized protein n=1 Tax=Cupriavidus metallidurans (strain ATCC 43123 / DSM 2839 / NBRC 102507 / CH34) TaxID=266264 RepID=D3DY61_CUPMC|nr:hypothetical protein [Cupriavidus metallidurans]ADC45231.1 hypothetical protein Rmet_6631 [Cupriavidus metallidurans CH34]AVA35081.1 hypothetical protein C3Z06_16695 [Cupriavidus metallidurans]KWW34230.1 hypothetical protein AU374_04457 [Cupriavidus metallidurans]MDE4921328.1 hypothetical protein [Cupriavidus metallidurans]QGS31819.1 hypothetical protein FOB83_23310 [Cupriavidus metallidurans]
MTVVARIVISGPLNGGWFVTPLHHDGTAGETRRFAAPEEARAFAAATYPGKPIRQANLHPPPMPKGSRVRFPVFPK